MPHRVPSSTEFPIGIILLSKLTQPIIRSLFITNRTKGNMKKTLQRLATSIFVLGIAAGIAACGGGSTAPSTPPAPDTSGSAAVVALKITDVGPVGTGATAVKNSKVTVHYTGWLYDVKASDLRGTKFDSSIGKAPLAFTVGSPDLIKGFDQGVEGMKVGGKRTLIIPSSLGYGANANGSIPANAALVFDVELVSVQ